MDILKLIKKRCSIRKYKNKPIPKKILNKIIEAGIWGPSVPSFLRIQPWKYVVITNRRKISHLAKILSENSLKSKAGVNILLNAASKIIYNAMAVIVIYKTNEMRDAINKYKALAANFGELIDKAQLSAISASIQNMLLVAESLNIGSCWLDVPLLSEKDINQFLENDEQLVAFLTLGYAQEIGRRSKRKPISDSVKYLK
jgi:nitroreductase